MPSTSVRLRSQVIPVLTRRPRARQASALLVGSGRSGTTWFSTLLADAHCAQVFEPGYGRRVPGAAQAGLEGSAYTDDRLTEAGLAHYLDAMAGRVLCGWTLRDSRPREVLVSRRLLIKEIRLVRQLPWLTPRLAALGYTRVALLVRDPLPLIESQLAFNGPDAALSTWEVDPDHLAGDHLLAAHPHLEKALDRLATVPELLAARWAVDHLAALSPGAAGYSVVSYERLRLDPVGEVCGLLQDWGWPVPSDTAPLAARSVAPSSVTRTRGAPLLDGDDRRRVEEVIDACGVVIRRPADGIPRISAG